METHLPNKFQHNKMLPSTLRSVPYQRHETQKKSEPSAQAVGLALLFWDVWSMLVFKLDFMFITNMHSVNKKFCFA